MSVLPYPQGLLLLFRRPLPPVVTFTVLFLRRGQPAPACSLAMLR